MAERLRDLPLIRAALIDNRVSWSLAEQLARHANPEDEAELLRAVDGFGVREAQEYLKQRALDAIEEAQEAGEIADGDRARRRVLAQEAAANEETVWCEVVETVGLEEKAALEATRWIIEKLEGKVGIRWVDALVGEAHATLAGRVTGLPEAVARYYEAAAERRQAIRERTAAAERAAESRIIAPEVDQGEVPFDDWVEALPEDLRELDRVAKGLSSTLASRDLWFGRIAEQLLRMGAPAALNYASEVQWARERLGMSLSSVKKRIRVARKSHALGPRYDAVAAGKIKFENADLIGRVATPETVAAWIERGASRSFKHLRQEVDAVRLLLDVDPEFSDAGPPTDETIRRVIHFEQTAMSGELMVAVATAHQSAELMAELDAPGQMCGHCSPEPEEPGTVASSPGQMCGHSAPRERETTSCATPMSVEEFLEEMKRTGFVRKKPKSAPREDERSLRWVRALAAQEPLVQPLRQSLRLASPPSRGRRKATTAVRLVMSEETALEYRELKEVFEDSEIGGSFIQFLILSFWESWGERLGVSDRWEPIYRRDRYRCACPVCDSRNVTLHHIKFRSHGGGHEANNVLSLCPDCHLWGVHEGRLTVTGDADELGRHLVWRLGRDRAEGFEGRHRSVCA
ncbi:MAG: HNH endonuclease [Myxococcota bacterium]